MQNNAADSKVANESTSSSRCDSGRINDIVLVNFNAPYFIRNALAKLIIYSRWFL